jgi:hypothetical protein
LRAIFSAVRSIIRSGIANGPDNIFGDQHLKTAVALIKLHKVRLGRYLNHSQIEMNVEDEQWDEQQTRAEAQRVF